MLTQDMLMEIGTQIVEEAASLLESTVMEQLPSDPESVEQWEEQKIQIRAIANQIRSEIERSVHLNLDWDYFDREVKSQLEVYSTNPDDYVQDL